MSEQPKSISYQLTCNNFKLEDFNGTGDTIHDRIRNIMIYLCAMYFCYCVEVAPTTNTLHIHIYVNFYKPTDGFPKLKGLFPTAHIEICKGDINSNYNYIMKHAKNKISDDEKDLKNGDYYEYGIRPQKTQYRYNYDLLIDKINIIEMKLDELIKK